MLLDQARKADAALPLAAMAGDFEHRQLALQLAKGFKTAIVLAALIGMATVVTGIFVSFIMNLPTGATIVIINFIFFIVTFCLRRVWR